MGSDDAGQTLGMVGSWLEDIWIPNDVVEHICMLFRPLLVDYLSHAVSFNPDTIRKIFIHP